MAQDAGERSQDAGGTPEAYVTISIRITRDTFELLRDAALAHVVTGDADGARVVVGGALKQPTVSDLIQSLIDRHRQILENDAEIVRGRRRA